jgi:hypothetical protein
MSFQIRSRLTEEFWVVIEYAECDVALAVNVTSRFVCHMAVIEVRFCHLCRTERFATQSTQIALGG